MSVRCPLVYAAATSYDPGLGRPAHDGRDERYTHHFAGMQMTQTWQKIALVTGGNHGIGKEIVLALARRGIVVALTYRANEDEAREVLAQIDEEGGRGLALRLDLAKSASFAPFLAQLAGELLARFGTGNFDFLINNAGFGKTVPIDQLSESDFDAFVDVHFKGVVFLTQKVLRMMNDDGAIIFITAAASRYNVPGYAAYAACKGAIEVFSRYVAAEYRPRGIRANAVAPGGIVTDFNNAAIRSNQLAQQAIVTKTPLGRIAFGRNGNAGRVQPAATPRGTACAIPRITRFVTHALRWRLRGFTFSLADGSAVALSCARSSAR